MDSKKALELWTDGKTWRLRHFFSGGGSMADLSSEAVIGEVEAAVRYVEEEGLGPD